MLYKNLNDNIFHNIKQMRLSVFNYNQEKFSKSFSFFALNIRQEIDDDL
jgi:hypothetical protein